MSEVSRLKSLLEEAIGFVVIAAPNPTDAGPVYCQSCRQLEGTAEEIKHRDNCIINRANAVIQLEFDEGPWRV